MITSFNGCTVLVFLKCGYGHCALYLLGRIVLGAQRPIVKLSRERSVGRSVCQLVCPVHCGKTADRIRMPFGVIGRTGPGMRQIVGFGDRSTEGVLLGANLGCAIVTHGDFTVYICDDASTV